MVSNRARAIRDLADAVHWLSAAIDTMTDGDMDDVALGEIRYAADAMERARKRILADSVKATAAQETPPAPLVGPLNDLLEDATS